MARNDIDISKTSVRIVEDSRDELVEVDDAASRKPDPNADLVAWVVARTDEWRAHRRSNYEAAWDRYERLFRGIWSGAERERKSERSKIVSPALAEAVEDRVAEVEEAIFGRGDFFDFRPERKDSEIEKKALENNKDALKEDLARSNFALEVSEVLLNGAVYGLGIGEIVLQDRIEREIVPQMSEFGTVEAAVVERDVTTAALHSVNPRNFLWDPSARRVEDGLGVAIEEDVGLHIIKAGQAAGDYRQVPVEASQPEPELGADKEESVLASDTAHVLRYYGLVPKKLLFPPENVADLDVAEYDTGEDEEELVEAVVVIANKQVLLKAVENPYLMRDRPVTIFKWDVIPGRLPGRGICEKGEIPQRLLDAELRSRMDALAFVSAPMMALDATRLPRGFKFDVAPGRSILTSGDPATVMRPFQFGQLDANTWQQATALDQMVQRATGAMNASAMAQSAVSGEARSGAVSMSLAGVVKRSKRTILHFVDGFFMPTLQKILWRNMQYNPERYMPLNSSFVPTSSVGIMQREYELMTMTQLLASVQPGTPIHNHLLAGIVANTGLPNRREVINMLQQQAQAPQEAVDTMQMQMQQAAVQLEIAEKQAKVRKLNAEANLAEAQAQTELVQPQLEARQLALKGIYEVPEQQQRAEFDRRMKLAETFIKQRDVESNERIARLQAAASIERERVRGMANMAAANAKARGEAAAAVAQAVASQAAEEPEPTPATLRRAVAVPRPDWRF